MIHMQNTATVVAIKPQSVTSGATATGNIDTLGFEYCSVDVTLDSQGSTTSNPSVLKITESEDTVVSNFAAITGLTGDATDGFTIPAAGTAATIVRLNIDLRYRKRYLKVTVSPDGATQILGANGILSRAKDSTVARAQMSGVADK